MRKIGIGNFQLPRARESVSNLGRLLWRQEIEELKFMASRKVFNIALRAVERAERCDCGHPFWNGLANCYLRVGERIRTLNDIFPRITRLS